MIEHGFAAVELLREFVVPTERCLQVGLTGGIGSGKSSIGQVWHRQGATVIDADQLARDLVVPGSIGLAKIIEAFGADILDQLGALDRRAMGSRVFADPQALADLEDIVHPLISQRKSEIFAELSVGNVAVYEVPLLVEKQMQADFDVVVVVDTNLQIRMERLYDRGLGREEALRRIAVQADYADRHALANIWVTNDGTSESLEYVAGQIGTNHFGLPALR